MDTNGHEFFQSLRLSGSHLNFAIFLSVITVAMQQPIQIVKKSITLAAIVSAFLLSGSQLAVAWDYEGHCVVNQLALAALPKDFPAFVRVSVAAERIAFLSGEPDRWRNMGNDLPLSHFNGPDHYLDLEQLDDYGLTPQTLPIFRYDFVAKLALARAAHPEIFSPIDSQRNKDHTRELVGFLPWAIVEYCGKLKSGFSYLKAFQEHGGTPEEIANAQANIIYIMGVMGHFVGDAAQPLHVTKHHHGWVGDNPHGYTTWQGFHQWIDGDYFRKTGGIKVESLVGKMRPAKIVGDPTKPDDLFNQVMGNLLETHKRLEPLYQLNKDQKLSAEGQSGPEGREFLEAQLVRGGQMLGDLWFSAWQQATEDKYLIRNLTERKALKVEKK